MNFGSLVLVFNREWKQGFTLLWIWCLIGERTKKNKGGLISDGQKTPIPVVSSSIVRERMEWIVLEGRVIGRVWQLVPATCDLMQNFNRLLCTKRCRSDFGGTVYCIMGLYSYRWMFLRVIKSHRNIEIGGRLNKNQFNFCTG